MKSLEKVYIVVSVMPLIYLGLVVTQTPGSLVSGYAAGAVIPLLAVISMILVLIGIVFVILRYRRSERVWHLVLATIISSPLAILVGWQWFHW